MKRILYLIFFLCTTMHVEAQEVKVLRGTVKDVNSNPISEAFVLLSDTTSANVGYVEIEETDSLGRFRITTKKTFNKVLVDRMGYTPATIKVTPSDSLLHVTMQSDGSSTLEEIVVRGYKKVMQLNSNGLTYNMAENPIKNGSTLDAMRFIPLIQVNNESVTIIGKKSVRYYVNGKELKLTGNTLTNYIHSLPAQDIERIEVITSYNPRFVSDSNEGAVNIILKKDENEGLKGKVGLRGWKTHYLKGRGNVMLSYNRGKLSTNLFITGQHSSTWQNKNVQTNYINLEERTNSHSLYDGKATEGSIQTILNYDFTPKSSLSGQVSIEYTDENKDETGDMLFTKATDTEPYANIMHNNSEDKDAKRVSAGITYQTSWEKGNMFRASLNYYYGDVSTSVLSRMDSVLVDKTSPHEHYQEIVPQKSNVWSGDALYTIMLGDKGSLNLDLRGYFWGINNNDRFYTINANVPVMDNLRSQHLKVDEWNLKATLSWTYNWNKQLQTRAGFGMTRRDYQSEQLGTQESYEQNFWQPNPFVNINITPSDKFSMSYDFIYEFLNPNFEQMNPFKWYSSATTYKVGNPTLSQAKRLKQSLMSQLFQKFVFSVNHTHIDDGIVSYSRVKENGMVETRPENMQTSDECTAYIGVNGISYWQGRGEMGANVSLTREWYRTNLPDTPEYNRKQNSYEIRMNNYLLLSKKAEVQMINNFSFSSKRTYGLLDGPASINIYTAIYKSIKNWDFSIYGNVQSFIYDSKIHLKRVRNYKTSELYISTLTKGEPYSYGIEISYRFGNNKVKDAKRKQSSSASVRNRLQ